MPTPPGNAPVGDFPEDRIPALAELYDKFAHSLEPFSVETDRAERVFMQEISLWYDMIDRPKPSFHDFRKGIILRCKRYLAASDRPPTI